MSSDDSCRHFHLFKCGYLVSVRGLKISQHEKLVEKYDSMVSINHLKTKKPVGKIKGTFYCELFIQKRLWIYLCSRYEQKTYSCLAATVWLCTELTNHNEIIKCHLLSSKWLRLTPNKG